MELVDALDSKSSEGNLVRVRFPPSVQEPELKNSGFFASKNNLSTTKTSSNYQKEMMNYEGEMMNFSIVINVGSLKFRFILNPFSKDTPSVFWLFFVVQLRINLIVKALHKFIIYHSSLIIL